MNVLRLSPYPPEKSGIADYSVAFDKMLSQEGIQIIKPKYLFVSRSTWWLFFDFIFRNKYWENLLDSIDFIHAEIGVHQAKEILTLFYFLRKRRNLKIFITVHDPSAGNYRIFKICGNSSGSFLSKIVNRISNKIEPIIENTFFNNIFEYILGHTSAVFVFNHRGVEQLLIKYQEVLGKINIINHPIFDFPKQEIKPIIGRNIVFAGFWSKDKGIETLIQAYYLLKKKGIGMPRLVLSGETQVPNSSYSKQIKKLVENLGLKDFVDFPGFLERKEMFKVLSGAFLVIPYADNISGSASGIYIAGLQAGAVTIVTDKLTLSGLTKNCDVSLLFRQEEEDLSNKISKLLQNQKLAYNLASSGQDFVYKYGDWKKLGKLIIRIYQKESKTLSTL